MMSIKELSVEELERQFLKGALDSGNDVSLIVESILHVNRAFASLSGHDRGADDGLARMLLVTRALNSLHWARQCLSVGYLTQALLLTRSAMEDWGSAVYVKRHPETAPLWLERPDPLNAKWTGPSFAELWKDAFSDMEADKAAEAAEKTKATYEYLSLFAHPRAASLPYLLTLDAGQMFFHVGPPREWDAKQFETGVYFLLTVVQAFFSTVDSLVWDTTGEVDDAWRDRASELSGQISERRAAIEDRVMNRVEKAESPDEAN